MLAHPGLGSLVKGLVELHGGRVEARSEGPGKGTVFEVRLPLEVLDVETPAPVRSEAPRTRRRVMVIEDNVDAAESLSELLQLSGHEVAVAYSGLEGIAKAREFSPDVVLCDIGLPGMDGYEVARALRGDQALSGAYLVALSGYGLPEDVQRADEADFQQHLAKPPNPEALEEVLARAENDRKAKARLQTARDARS